MGVIVSKLLALPPVKANRGGVGERCEPKGEADAELGLLLRESGIKLSAEQGKYELAIGVAFIVGVKIIDLALGDPVSAMDALPISSTVSLEGVASVGISEGRDKL